MLKLLKLTPRKIQPFQPLYEDALRQVRELKTEIEGLKAIQMVDEILREESEKQVQNFRGALEKVYKVCKEACPPAAEIAKEVLQEKQTIVQLRNFN